MKLWLFALPTLLSMSAALPACAQALPAQIPQYGAGRVTSIKIDNNVAYDTDQPQTSAAEAARRGLSLEDFTWTPDIALNVLQPIGRQAVFINGSAGYDFHRKNSVLDSRRVDLVAGGMAQLGPCQFALNGGYRSAQSQLTDLTSTIVKNIQTVDSAGAQMQCQRQTGLVFSASTNRDKVTNSETLQRMSNSTTQAETVSLGYQSAPVGQIAIVAGYTESSYPNQILTLGGTPGERLRLKMLGLSYEKKVGSKIDVRLNVSRTQIERSVAPAGIPPKTSSNTYRGEVIYNASSRLMLDLLVDRAVVPSFRTGKLYDIDQDEEFSAHYRVGSAIDVVLGFRRAEVSSNTGTIITVDVPNHTSTDAGYATIRYRQSSKISWALDLRQTEAETSLANFNYRDTKITLSNNIAF